MGHGSAGVVVSGRGGCRGEGLTIGWVDGLGFWANELSLLVNLKWGRAKIANENDKFVNKTRC